MEYKIIEASSPVDLTKELNLLIEDPTIESFELQGDMKVIRRYSTSNPNSSESRYYYKFLQMVKIYHLTTSL